MSDSLTLNETSKIYVHIIDINGADFQWFTDPKTFQILEHDSFNTFKNKIINKLSSKYPERSSIIESLNANIIECLNDSDKLAIFIDKVADNWEAVHDMKQKFNDNQSKIKLKDVPVWMKLAKLPNMCVAKKIINVNAYEFILIPLTHNNITNWFKYNSITNSFNEYIKNSSLQMDYNSKAAFNEKEQIIYIYDAIKSSIHSVDATTSICTTFQLKNKNLSKISRYGLNFLFVNNHLHFIANHDSHWIRSIQNNTLNIIADSTKKCTAQRMDGAAIFISSKQCILLIGGHNIAEYSFSDVWIYKLQTQKWSKIDNISFNRYQFGYVLTSNQRYVILFGGQTSPFTVDGGCFNFMSYYLEDASSHKVVDNIFVLDMEDDNNWKLKQCKIKCRGSLRNVYGAKTGGSNILVNGFIKNCFKLKEFAQLQLPTCIGRIIGEYFSAETIHYIDEQYNHYG
eukprot:431268_1